LYLLRKAKLDKPELVELDVLDDQAWTKWLAAIRVGFAEELGDETLPDPDENAFKRKQQMCKSTPWVWAYFAPRGIGPTEWNKDERKRTQIRRRFMLLGQTRDGMRVWDVRRAIQALRAIDSTKDLPLDLDSRGEMAGIVLYASLFEPDIAGIDLWHLPRSHREGPIFLNVLRYLDAPQAVAMAAERCRVTLYQKDDSGWRFPQAVAKNLGWPEEQFQVEVVTIDSKP
jgi:hypothetical protein